MFIIIIINPQLNKNLLLNKVGLFFYKNKLIISHNLGMIKINKNY